ncbi:MAG: hypothetical protein ACREQ9_13370, partial [Candidatus Binatia bacterium]
MKGRRVTPWVFLLVLSLVSCGPDGGTSGTGITGGTSGTGVTAEDLTEGSGITTIEGNVSGLEQARRPVGRSVILVAELKKLLEVVPEAIAQSGVEGIRVRVEGTGAEDVTDWNGWFSVSGSFEEGVTLVFERASGETSELGVIVPSGGVLSLENVVIDFGDGSARAARQTVRFEAVVERLDCAHDIIGVTSRFDPNGSEYTVHTNGAMVRSTNGSPVRCSDLREEDRVRIEGPIRADGSIGAEGSRQAQQGAAN